MSEQTTEKCVNFHETYLYFTLTDTTVIATLTALVPITAMGRCSFDTPALSKIPSE